MLPRPTRFWLSSTASMPSAELPSRVPCRSFSPRGRSTWRPSTAKSADARATLDLAIGAYENALRLAPSNAIARLGWAWLIEKRGDTAKAIATYRALVQEGYDRERSGISKRGVTFTLTTKDLVSRLVALAPPAKSHLTSFHGAYAPHAKLRGGVTAAPGPVESPKPVAKHRPAKATKPRRPRLDWATLHQHTFGNDVLRCPCGGRRTIKALDRKSVV